MKIAPWIVHFALGGVACICAARSIAAQGQPCSDMPYLHQNQLDREPIELSEVQGTAVDQNGKAVAQLCMGIFTMDQRKLLRFAQTDSHGNFTIDTKGLVDGTYRLMGYFIGFCPANAIITIHSHPLAKKPLAVRMNVPVNPDCSTIEVSKK
jgi:hypothetical protein